MKHGCFCYWQTQPSEDVEEFVCDPLVRPASKQVNGKCPYKIEDVIYEPFQKGPDFYIYKKSFGRCLTFTLSSNSVLEEFVKSNKNK